MEDNYSDEEILEKEHDRLLKAVSQLDKSQHIKNPTRTEPSLQISEYNLVKTSAGKNSSVNLHNLVKVLNKKSSQIEISKKVNKVRRNVKTIPKPLEKPVAQKIKRTVGYENLKKSLDKWEPIIYANKAAEQLKFPLRKDAKLTIETTSDLMKRFRIKSEIELEMEKLQPVSIPEECKSEFPLTLAEMLERRKEAAKLRAQQSYIEAKARRQSKIKSKKYHRIQRREKIKQQIKEFEYLQKNNPEEALKKLEEIEKARADERMSLRHRSTGQWARNKQVRAKYDKESRQVLAQQLAVSRDLTQKLANDENSESENEDEQINSINSTTDNSTNPWISGIKPTAEVTDFITGYRKYWNDKNNLEKALPTPKSLQETEIMDSVTSTTMDDDILDEKSDENEIANFKKKLNELKTHKKVKKTKEVVKKANKKRKKTVVVINGWEIEELNTQDKKEENIDEIFDDIEYKLKKKLEKGAQKLKNSDEPMKKRKKQLKSKNKYKPDLSLKSQRQIRPDLDEGLIETDHQTSSTEETVVRKQIQTETDKVVPDIDPSSFVHIEPKHLKTQILNDQNLEDALDDDEELETNQQALISEAFEDDDIIEDFHKDKKAEIDANTPKDIDLSLPGWGSWGGLKITNKRKRKRFIVKQPKKIIRKDDNKGHLIIKEHKDVKIKEHQVNDLPFPFKTVQDFEASIRAPLGNTFLPETAHRRLVKPSVAIKSGAIIEPMDDSQLVLNKIRKLKKGIL